MRKLKSSRQPAVDSIAACVDPMAAQELTVDRDMLAAVCELALAMFGHRSRPKTRFARLSVRSRLLWHGVGKPRPVNELFLNS